MNRPVNVLLLVDSLTPEAGTENQIVELARRMDRSRVQLYLACMEDGSRLQSLAGLVVPWVFPAPGIFSFAGIREALRLRGYLKDHSIDIVHTFMVRSAAFGVIAATGTSCKAVLTSRRNLGYANGPKYRLLFRFLNLLTTRITANSQEARRITSEVEQFDPSRIDVLYNGVDIQRFSLPKDPAVAQQWNLPPSGPIVGLVANLRPVKNQALFLRAARIVLDQIPNAIFVLAGRGPADTVRHLHDLAADLGIERSVRWVQDDVARLLPWFTVGCLTSTSESFSNAVLEYMAAGLPVVATNVGGIREALEEGKTGFLVPSGDAPAFAAALIRILRDEPLRNAFGQRARRRCEQEFSLEAAARQHADYYESLVTGRRSRPASDPGAEGLPHPKQQVRGTEH